jgi:hypothetical protein
VTDGTTVTFGGTATGAITITVAADGTATFSRGGITATGTVTGSIADKVIGSDSSTPLIMNFTGTAAANTFVFNAPNATDITLQGDLAAETDSVTLKVADVTADRSINLDSSVEHGSIIATY